MDNNRFPSFNLELIPTPCYLIDETLLEKNLALLKQVQEKSQCKILLALKAFAMFSTFPLIRQYLYGVSASSPHEARLGREEFGREVHTYAPAYSQRDIDQLISHSNYLIFNSLSQWQRYVKSIPEHIRCGLRINPEYSEIKTDLYNPCAKKSRLGMTRQHLKHLPSGISGLHFHAMCEQNADTLERLLEVVEEKFSKELQQVEWVNFGGGHHITRSDYNVELLIDLITRFRKRYGVTVFLEPGEAVALNTGVLVTSVLDIVENDISIAILDTSAEAHMPDILGMPYRPEIIGAEKPEVYPYKYRLAGPTCLAGDIIGDYSFSEKLVPGSKIVLLDMAHYSMVKNNTFNGVALPSIAIRTSNDDIKIIRTFTYNDYKDRLS